MTQQSVGQHALMWEWQQRCWSCKQAGNGLAAAPAITNAMAWQRHPPSTCCYKEEHRTVTMANMLHQYVSHLGNKLALFQVMCHHHRHQLPVEHKVQHGGPLLLQQGTPQRRAAEVDAHKVLQRLMALAADAKQAPEAEITTNITMITERGA
jgi:hypothetical protein